MKGRVIKSTGSWYTVQVDLEMIQARLKGKFKQDELKLTNPIAVGDWVGLDLEEGQATGVIREIFPRENYVIRKSTRKQHFSHIIASNLDQAMLVITMKNPRTSLGFIDRFLVSTESFRIPAILVVNKMDLMEGEDAQDWLQDIHEIYEPLGYPVVEVSALENQQLKDLLIPHLQGKSTLISGHSGVGKSTLLNRLIPDARQETKEVSGYSSKGVHTTTFAEMFFLKEGGDLIDTPGIKEFGILEIEEYELSHYFPEMRAHLGECKYNNCQHVNEPGCKILKQLEEGYIHPYRYESYVNILNEEDSHR
ncbi:MAG TPA: ribosome small subunit-dependent GTPase A [Algoriphagus sp.]|jgi:ribosome biogenesis GTPase / thiamine phosphate phosphatase|uniref:ribosome small subunit-dependent GTPase A n=1 Tax=unclassified Algoriphagus TaxID=2641541 RepID=UPI000C5B9A70|nr:MULTISPECIES: ribosome small subunit-dependent GTPase A [unclassified Algoriphagus]MAL13130.1 ribosome small subunit-dependent GTPase A [Algoriphagus sp.]MAN87285.1 ribosome small subunit-dependent GTPase A [Algoriphagus sp.]QYH41069.1 ribosome small subunit-dependent GTPase A [Algoriphagus sp. NBT04N3]HAH36280.1 ribosome small subunit-dependent GTPase A [Algoriphagus sp.]HCB45880.1 ribosome small subunit-dependent GTPase A [Algoriphagus sp.]|tara:strand:- start:1458 stop:2381 length:924 start_codon:yes stop_codon:yes gene_type:complete